MTQQTDPPSITAYIAQRLRGLLSQLETPPATLVVGFSGGVDSTVLLHAAVLTSPLPVHGVYIHHGLSTNADEWQAHCQRYCQQHQIPFHAIHVDVVDQARKSLEEQARNARYAALTAYCQQHQGALLLGQHQDDQLETLLLTLKRGSGPLGLAAMTEISYRGHIAVLRPLLSLSRRQIEQTALAHDLNWIFDESNLDPRFDRNFLRNDIIPLLKKRWPHIASTAARSCDLLQEQNAMLQDVIEERYTLAAGPNHTLLVKPLLALKRRWQRAVCRHWLAKDSLAMPSQAQLDEILRCLHAREDAQPLVQVGDYAVRRFAGALYVCQPLAPATEAILVPHQKHHLPWWYTDFIIQQSGAWRAVPFTSLSKVYSVKNRVSKTPRKWLKEWHVPPWERDNVPLLLKDDEPVAVLLKETVVELQDGIADKIVIY
ncbi:tRNA lysidine(34) synthetase TilS [Alteromonas sp. 14N.309.X.WAT.G.H12]|uniref:tRNA lysidine(34) synthetase TilS n=1 Tax=Alteromonas sp. 14N.309.X.WAT.G.H12 TaxID=3120824 RepID=UPI002FD4139D